VEFLRERIQDYDNGSMQGDPAWDKEELGALLWAIAGRKEWMARDPLFDVLWTPNEWTRDTRDHRSQRHSISTIGSGGSYLLIFPLAGWQRVFTSDPRYFRMVKTSRI
jgi:hypothetical protein